MTSYDEENSGPDFTPAYGVQLHDPRLLEYVGAPESARLLSRSPKYWVHVERENTRGERRHSRPRYSCSMMLG